MCTTPRKPSSLCVDACKGKRSALRRNMVDFGGCSFGFEAAAAGGARSFSLRERKALVKDSALYSMF